LRYKIRRGVDTLNAQGNPLSELVRRQGLLVLDGGLATSLEARGHDLDDDLWSARVLLEEPDVVRDVHREFLEAGADCIVAASYQASLPGLRRRGLSDGQADDVLDRSVRLAVEARDAFWSDRRLRAGRLRPLVAAGVGPYGAFLADGSEYTGDYGVDASELHAFHARRFEVLADSEADLLACETIPSRPEADVLLRLLRETPDRWAWLSFTCRDESHLSDGSAVVDVARACDAEARVAGVGVNCTAPERIAPLIGELRRGTAKPLLVYPNSGERWDAGTRTWLPADAPFDWDSASSEWVRLGAAAVGGCCRVDASRIARLRKRLLG
jgi:homocysteine S-methyltransferase